MISGEKVEYDEYGSFGAGDGAESVEPSEHPEQDACKQEHGEVGDAYSSE